MLVALCRSKQDGMDNPFIRKYVRKCLAPNHLVYGCFAIPNHANCRRSVIASVAFAKILTYPFFFFLC